MRYPPTITAHGQAVALLNDPDYTVLTEPPGGQERGVGWLRGAVPRFAAGPVHARRRVLVAGCLARLDPGDLRRRAARLSTMDGGGADVVHVLAPALGIDADVAPLLAAIAPAYFPGSVVDRCADAALDELVIVLGGRFDEQTAATICLLVQAHDATAGLVRNVRTARDTHPAEVHSGQLSVGALLAEVLRYDPPVPSLRRTGPAGVVTIDVRAANRDGRVFVDPDTFNPYRSDAGAHLTFGTGPRSCPGAPQALAVAAGLLGSH